MSPLPLLGRTAERRARLQGEAEREYSVLQSTNGGEATSCQNGTEWEVIITDALQEAEFEGEEARLDAWLERNQQSWLPKKFQIEKTPLHTDEKTTGVYDAKTGELVQENLFVDEIVYSATREQMTAEVWDSWIVTTDINRPYHFDCRERFWSSHGGRLFNAAVNIAKTVARAQAQSARVTTGAAPVTNNNGFALLADPYDEEERGQSGTEAFMLRLDKATEKTKVTRPNACPSAATDDPDHEDWVAGLQRELAVLRTQAQPPEKSTFETVESLQALRTRARHTDAQADSKDAKAGILSCVGDKRTEKLIAIQLETEHLLHACAQAWKLLPAISPRTHEDGDGDVRMGEDGDVHMGEDGEYCWNSISCEQLRQILESPRNGIWYEAKAWVTTRTARFTALTSSLDADDAFTVIPKKNSKTAKKGSGESATGDSLDSAFATLAQMNEDFAVQRSKITQTYKAWMNQAHDRSSNQNVSNRKR